MEGIRIIQCTKNNNSSDFRVGHLVVADKAILVKTEE